MFLLRGLLAGLGVALALAGPLAGWGVFTWGTLMVGLLLAAGALLAGPMPPRSAFRWASAMLLAVGLLHVWHWNQESIPKQPGLYGSLFAGLLILAGITIAAARGAWVGVVWQQLRGWRGLVLLVCWVYATARWFNDYELATRPDNVLRGCYLLLAVPLGGLALIAAAKALPDAWLLKAVERGRRLGSARTVPLWIMAFATVLCGVVCYCCLGPLPHVEDGVAYLYQAKTMLASGFYQPAPPAAMAFDARFCWIFMDDLGRSYGIFPPGWPLLLAVGVKLGLPWLINPLLVGLGLLLVWTLVDLTDDRPTAALTIVLLALSPFVVVQGASFMSHPATLLWILVAMVGAAKAVRGGGWSAGLLVGLGIGMTLATRYVEGMILGLVLAGALAGATVRKRVPVMLWLAGLLGLAPGLGMALADNQAKTGSPFLTPVERWYTVQYGAPINRPGFGPDVGLEWDHSLAPGHSLLEGLWNTNANLFELSRCGLGWACGSLTLALLFLVCGRLNEGDRLWLAYSLGLIAIYTAYWYHGIAFGPRFLHPLVVPLAIGTVKGGRLVGGWLGEQGARRVAAVCAMGVVTAWLAWLPLELMTTYHDLRGREAADRRILPVARAAAGGQPCVVILAMRKVPGGLAPDYAVPFSLNPPGFDGDVLVARSMDGEGVSQIAALQQAYPNRKMLVWYKTDGPDQLIPLDDAGPQMDSAREQ